MIIRKAVYGEHELTAWVQQHMDTPFWEFLVLDELLRVARTPPDTTLTVEWELQPNADC
jgi:hypothetical protein